MTILFFFMTSMVMHTIVITIMSVAIMMMIVPA